MSPHPAPPPPRPCLQSKARQALTSLAMLTTVITITAVTTPVPLARATPPAWRWPLDGSPRVLRRFAPPSAPWLAGHRGIDLAAPADTPVLAAGTGTVHYAGSVGGRGVVTVDHPGGLRTTYLPITASVKQGEPITMGARLGVVQATQGHCQESCLHWGLIEDSRYLDPLLLLGHAPIRLLPIWPETTTPPITPPLLPLTPKALSEAPLTLPFAPSERSAASTTTPLTAPPLPNLSAALYHPNPSAFTSPNLPAPPALHLPTSASPPLPQPFIPLHPPLLTVLGHHDSPFKAQNALPSPNPTALQALAPIAIPDTKPLITTPEATPSPPETRSSNLPIRTQSVRTPEQRHDPSERPATPRKPVVQLLAHAASMPAAPAIGLGTLLGVALLITALRRRRRPHKKQHSPRTGQHRKPPRSEGAHRRPGSPSQRSS
ncbi:peptidoglycan DD-metalloendopeptidase family protein [Nonomuraea sp. NPDC052265]|uniref:M23 family metallopeptidase n=1 Tax=Nonomuraea sp. NPDC052265 TaxID=3364374 RepID=UPI0037C9AFE6